MASQGREVHMLENNSVDVHRVPSSNKSGRIELSIMAKSKPPTRPMRIQPIDRGLTMPTPMATAGAAKKGTRVKRPPTQVDETRAAEARITLRNSLKKQRDALKAAQNTRPEN